MEKRHTTLRIRPELIERARERGLIISKVCESMLENALSHPLPWESVHRAHAREYAEYQIFGEKYSNLYDSIYRDKDYSGEVDFLEQIFDKYYDGKVKTVLDLACGTANHVIELARRGYEATGVDASNHMLRIGREKMDREGLGSEFHGAAMQSFWLDGNYDVGICMFNSFGYLLHRNERERAVLCIGPRLEKHGLLILDVWNASAGEHYEPLRVKTVDDGDRKIVRISTTRKRKQYYTVDFDLYVSEGAEIDIFGEHHAIMAFYPTEIGRLLEKNGFDVLEICPFMSLGKPLSNDDWNMTVVARKK